MTDAALSITRSGKFALLQRYALAVIAPASVSAAHLLVQITLLATVTPVEFGTFAFLMVVVQFGFGLSNALVSTPYTVTMSTEGDGPRHAVFFSANALFAVVFGFAVFVIGAVVAHERWTYLFAVFALLAMVRWFGRAHAYAMLRPAIAGLSDLIYAGSLVVIVAALAWRGMLDLQTVSLAFVAASLLGCGVLGGDFLARQIAFRDLGALKSYAEVWRSQSRWTLLGVATTEATANAHVYLVTLFAGPAAFAPIAAAALFVRPVLLAMTSLSQLEIPVLGRAIAAGRFAAATRTSRRFLAALLLIWLLTAFLALGVITYMPSLIIKPAYPLHLVEIAIALFLAVSLLQVWQGPNSALLQAAKTFRALSGASVVACGFSISGVVVALLLLPPVYSLLGVLAGQLVMAVMLVRLVRNWRRAHA